SFHDAVTVQYRTILHRTGTDFHRSVLPPSQAHSGTATRWGDDGNNCIFITGDFSRGRGKENGTIPF
ncbi:MAG: hypothetical protein ABSF34_10495, partial [Verrucomicrobiota bacterium]